MEGYGLVLGGGGAKGSYEIGVWKALRELEIPLIAVAGTSVGALNGAMIIQNDYDKALKLWTSISIEAIINMNKATSVFEPHDIKEEIVKLVKAVINSGGLDAAPLKKLLLEIIDEQKIRNSHMDFGIVTFSLTDLKPITLFKEDIPEGKMVDYLLASASFPAFRPMEINGKKFIDGAVYDNIPVSLMLQRKIYDVIAVDISGVGRVRKVKDRDLNIIRIKNSEDLGPLLAFDVERVKRNIEIGYYDTMKAFGKYKGKYYYLTDTNSSIKLDENHVRLAYSLLGIDWDKRQSPQNRFIIYKLIRNLKKYSHDGKFRNTGGVILAAAEITAEVMGIERLKEYTSDDLISMIIEHYNLNKTDKALEDFANIIETQIWNTNRYSFTEKMKKTITESKFAALYSADVNDLSERTVLYRRLLALTYPKVCIANIFLAFLLNIHLDNKI
ncbi:MAG TPA: patatin-like phospholipase family protein [Clostridiales bacterium]|nr:patatin-like phospholipase family protein [Clostridiales bacterium]